MATLEKLEILGIRSFGPTDPQKLSFISPVTLIHGPNGTGKTTVIECLRYATTGDQPPNTKGGAFLYDPKLCDENEIKAQVKLVFSDVSGEKCLISRSQKATRKGAGVTTKTLDQAMKRQLKNGETRSLDSRQNDINAEMKHALGVSAPILQNVIFCHQEESNWPLSEGKALKQKFDDIFASTRYVKALDSITSTRKKITQEVKIKEVDIQLATRNKHLADETVDKKLSAEKLNRKANEEYEKVDTELRPVEEKINKIHKEIGEINNITRELERKKTEYQLMKNAVDEIRVSLGDDVHEGSTDGLKQVLQDFEQEVDNKKKNLTDEESQLKTVDVMLSKIRTAESELIARESSLTQEKSSHQKCVTSRDEKIRVMSRELGLQGYSSISGFSQNTLEQFNTQTEDKKRAIQKQLDQAKAQFEAEADEIQTRLDEVNRRKAGLDETCRIKRDIIKKNKDEIKSIHSKLCEVESSSSRLDSITYELSRAERELNQSQNSLDAKSMQDDIQKLQNERNQLNVQLREISRELDKAHQLSEERAKIEILTRDQSERQEQIKRIKNKVKDTVCEVLGSMPDTDIKTQLDIAHQKMQEELRTNSQTLQDKKMEKNSLENKISSLREKIEDMEKEITNIKSKITEQCPIDRFDETLLQVNEQIADFQDKRGLLHGIKEMYQRYIRLLADPNKDKHEAKCPLCKRQFGEVDEVDELITDLETSMKTLPQRMKTTEQELTTLQIKSEKLQQLIPQKRHLTDLESSLPALKIEQNKMRSDIQELQSVLGNLEADVTMKQDDEESLSFIKPDVIKMDQLYADCKELSSKIELQEFSISAEETVRPVKELQNINDELQTDCDTKLRNAENLQRRLTNHTESVQRLRTRINDLNSSKLDIQKNIQEKVKLEEQKTSLQTDNSQLQREIERALDQVGPTDREISSFSTEKRLLRTKKETTLDDLTHKQQKLTIHLSELTNYQSEIQRYIDEGKDEKLAETQQNLVGLRDHKKKKVDEQKTVTESINRINKQLADQKVRERKLQDNLKLREKQEEVSVCEKEVQITKQKLNGLDISNIEKTRSQLLTQQENLRGKKYTALEQQRATKEQITQLERELCTPDLKDAHKVYIEKHISLKVDQMAGTDLDKYHKALERAIMQYHKKKMEDLNRIIKNLWRETYRGNDIDSIEIRSDSDSSDSMEAVDLNKRKTYNYRVVMIRDQTEMDMRGRCSAGQKVLASLIIRLALAETFCLSCGILALDEPTTNLDVENIESLAYALAQIIKQRAAQKNFQLIIITHDNQFVETISREIGVEFYYKIGKNPRGQSELRKSKIDDIMY